MGVMKARACFTALIVGLTVGPATIGEAQGTLGESPTRRVQSSDAPVTHREASAVIARMEQIIRSVVLRSSAKGTSKIASSNSPVQRTEIVKEFNRLFELCRPKFKFTPDMVSYDAKAFTVGNDANMKAIAGKLVNWGSVGKVSPLVASSKPTVTVAELGDAVGFFLLRMSELTHTPSVKFSPPMMHDGG